MALLDLRAGVANTSEKDGSTKITLATGDKKELEKDKIYHLISESHKCAAFFEERNQIITTTGKIIYGYVFIGPFCNIFKNKDIIDIRKDLLCEDCSREDNKCIRECNAFVKRSLFKKKTRKSKSKSKSKRKRSHKKNKK